VTTTVFGTGSRFAYACPIRNYQGIFVRRSLSLKIAIPLFGLVLALGIGEAAARFLEGPIAPVAATPDPFRFYDFDSVLGWANRPGSYGTFRRREFAYPVTINRYGMRYHDFEVPKKPGVMRIAVLGDSYTWGIGAREDERYPDRVEARFKGAVEVLNFGVTGYGPIQYYLNLDRVLSFRPDVIVLGFCLGNDMVDNAMSPRYGYFKPYVSLTADGFAVQGYPLPNVYEFDGRPRRETKLAKFMGRHSAFYRRWELKEKVSARQGAELKGLGLAKLRPEFFYYDERLPEGVPEQVKSAIEINRRILTKITEKVSGAGIQLAVMAVPTKCELGQCTPERTLIPNNRQRERLRELTAELKVPFIDFPSTFALEDFWADDGHWRPTGHAKMAQALAEYVESLLPQKAKFGERIPQSPSGTHSSRNLVLPHRTEGSLQRRG